MKFHSKFPPPPLISRRNYWYHASPGNALYLGKRRNTKYENCLLCHVRKKNWFSSSSHYASKCRKPARFCYQWRNRSASYGQRMLLPVWSAVGRVLSLRTNVPTRKFGPVRTVRFHHDFSLLLQGRWSGSVRSTLLNLHWGSYLGVWRLGGVRCAISWVFCSTNSFWRKTHDGFPQECCLVFMLPQCMRYFSPVPSAYPSVSDCSAVLWGFLGLVPTETSSGDPYCPEKAAREAPDYQHTQHSALQGGQTVFTPTPSGKLFHTGKCSCVISSLLLRKDRGGWNVLSSMVHYEPCRSMSESKIHCPAACTVLALRREDTEWNQPGETTRMDMCDDLTPYLMENPHKCGKEVLWIFVRWQPLLSPISLLLECLQPQHMGRTWLTLLWQGPYLLVPKHNKQQQPHLSQMPWGHPWKALQLWPLPKATQSLRSYLLVLESPPLTQCCCHFSWQRGGQHKDACWAAHWLAGYQSCFRVPFGTVTKALVHLLSSIVL